MMLDDPTLDDTEADELDWLDSLPPLGSGPGPVSCAHATANNMTASKVILLIILL